MIESKRMYLRDYSYRSHSLDSGILTVTTTGRAGIQILMCASGTFRVFIDPEGSFRKEASYAVENESFDYSEYTVEDGPDELFVRSGSCSLRITKFPLSLAFLGPDGFILNEEYKDFGFGWQEDGTVFAYFKLRGDEHFYGLGQSNQEYLGRLDRRGSRRDMITGQCISRGCVTADLPVTFFLSTGHENHGYGMFFDNSWHCEFDMGKESDDYYSYTAEGGELLFYFINGPEFSKILKGYTELTGRPSLPPLWALGYIQSKCTYYCWDDLDEAIGLLREKGIPMDCMVIDAGWSEDMINFKFDSRFEGKSAERIAEHTAENGVKFMLSTAGPMIKKDSSNFESGLKAGIFATDGKGNTVTCGWYGGELMDFTAPNMKSWLAPQLKPLHDMGIKAWWLDLIEPEGEPLQTHYHGGPRGKIHNAYALLNTKLYYEILKEFDPDSRPFILGRTATAGIQKYGAATWTGDVYSRYDTLEAHCAEALGAAMSGLPAWTCDTSGFISAENDPALDLGSQLYKNDEAAQGLLYERWLQFSCFTPITRSHHVGPCEPYAHTGLGESSAAHYLKLRYRLLPYIYSYAKRAQDTGISIMRPLIYHYQEDEGVWDRKDEYLFGEELLVAPVLTENTTARKVYFPAGTWIDYDYGYEYEGGTEAVVYAPQNRIPVFVKKGSILPMAPEMRYSDERPWDVITLDIYPAKAGPASFLSWLDDGRTTAYERGEFTTVSYTLTQPEEHLLLLRIEESNRKFVPERYELCVHMDRAPVAVRGLTRYSHRSRLRSAGEGWFFDRIHNILYVLLPNTPLPVNGSSPGPVVLTVEIETAHELLYKAPAPLLDSNGRVTEAETEAAGAKQMPWLLPPASVPCKLQLENYDRGGEGISYHMLTKGNVGNLYRKDDVNIKECTDLGGGYMLFSIYPGEWLEYTVYVEEDGYYDLKLRVSCEEDGASFHVDFDEKNLTGKVSIPNTGRPEHWADAGFDHVKLHAGEQVVRLFIETGTVNLNYMELARSE